MLDLRSGAYRVVTAVPDGTFLRPLARWGEGSVLVGEARSGALERYWIYDATTWARRPIELPTARTLFLADTSRIALLGVESGGTAPLTLWEAGRASPLGVVRLDQPALAWSPDGRRLALTGSFDEPVPDQPGSFVTRYVADVIELR
jgi:hypothetical protein